MTEKSGSKLQEQTDLPETTGGFFGTGTRVAPAVALLLLSESVYAQDFDDGAHPVPEPSTLGLLAAGAAVGGIAAYIRSRRRK